MNWWTSVDRLGFPFEKALPALWGCPSSSRLWKTCLLAAPSMLRSALGGFRLFSIFPFLFIKRRWTKEQLQSKYLKAPWPGSIAAFVHHGAAKFAEHPLLALSQKDREGLGAKPPLCAVCLWWSEEQKVPALHMPSRLRQDCRVNAVSKGSTSLP